MVRAALAGHRPAADHLRATLDAGGDPAVVSAWSTEIQARKLAAEARLRAQIGSRPSHQPARMSAAEITAVVNATTDVITVLHTAEPADKVALYTQLGLRLTYTPGPRTAIARAEPRQAARSRQPGEIGISQERQQEILVSVIWGWPALACRSRCGPRLPCATRQHRLTWSGSTPSRSHHTPGRAPPGWPDRSARLLGKTI